MKKSSKVKSLDARRADKQWDCAVALDEQIDREQWALGRQMAAAVSCLNAPFCDDGPAAASPEWCQEVAAVVARECGGIMALEDAMDVLTAAIQMHPNNKDPDNPLKDHPLRKILKKEQKWKS